MAATVVVGGGGGAIATTGSTTLPVTITLPTLGNLLVLGSSGFANVSSISGGGVTTWTKIQFNSGDTNHNDNDCWFGVVDTTPSTTVTVTYSASSSLRSADIVEVAGAQKATDVVVASGNDAQGSTDSKTITTLTAGCLIFSYLGSHQASGTATATAPTGYTALTSRVSTTNGLFAAYLQQAAAGASTMNWSGMSSTAWPSMGAVAIKAAAGAITGNAAITLAGPVTSGAGTVLVQGASAVTLAGIVTSGAGTVASTGINGAASLTLSGPSATAAGTVLVQGTSSTTLATPGASGNATLAIQGASAASLVAPGVSSAGVVLVQGSSTGVFALASTGSGAVLVQGVSLGHLAATVTGTGTVGSSAINGDGLLTLAPVATGLGAVLVQGSATVTLALIVQAAGSAVQPERVIVTGPFYSKTLGTWW